jgi:hypothetical protein
MVSLMSETRTQRYEGLYRSQVQEAYRADAVLAAANGWFPSGEQWIGESLVVTYAQGRAFAPPAAAMPAPAVAPPARPRNLKPLVWLLAAIVAGSALGLAFVGRGPSGDQPAVLPPDALRATPGPLRTAGGFAQTAAPLNTAQGFGAVKAQARKVGYKALLRDPDVYAAKLVYFKGRVLQATDDGAGGQGGLIAVTRSAYGFWDDNVSFSWASRPRLVPNDIVEFVMTASGNYGYESAGAGYLTVPSGIIIKLRLVK